MLSKRRRHYEKYVKEPTSNCREPADLGRLGKYEVFFPADSGRPGANRFKAILLFALVCRAIILYKIVNIINLYLNRYVVFN